MDSTEILTNDQVTEVGNEITTANSKFVKVVAGLGLTVLISGVAYKYLIKPIIKKHKAKKEAEVDDLYSIDIPVFDEDDEDDEN